jgi:hypothetical protein
VSDIDWHEVARDLTNCLEKRNIKNAALRECLAEYVRAYTRRATRTSDGVLENRAKALLAVGHAPPLAR